MAPKRRRREAEAETSSAGRSFGAARRATASRRSASQRPTGAAALWQAAGRAPATPLDPRLAERDPPELLRRLLAPLGPHDFLRGCWGRTAVALQGPPGRLRPLLRDFLHDLNLKSLLEETPSERVHAWIRPPREAEPAPEAQRQRRPALESVAVDAESALVLAQAGAALYFRAPEELEALLVPGISAALRAGFAGHYPGDGRPRGEIETFFAGRGHVTGWHTDFQHNFTVQLRGSKTWRFKAGPVEHCVRALTPHYRSRVNYEQQMKLLLTSDPASPEYRPPDAFFEDAEEVTLTAGAVLYHPAGIWHHVECVSDDSVSINVSLSGASWAELVGNGVQQLLWASPLLRAPIVGVTGAPARARAAAEAVLAEARRRVAALTVEDLLPPAVLEAARPPRRVNVATSRLGAALAVRPSDRFRISKLAVLVELPQGPAVARGGAPECSASSSASSEASEGEGAERGSSGEAAGRRAGAVGAGARRVYALHANFGNEDVASWLRVRLAVPFPLSAAVAWLQQRHLQARRAEEEASASGSGALGTFTARELLAASRAAGHPQTPAQWTRVARLLRVLCHCGYLRKAPPGLPGTAAAAKRRRARGAGLLRSRALASQGPLARRRPAAGASPVARGSPRSNA